MISWIGILGKYVQVRSSLSGISINNSLPLLSQRASEKGSFLRGYVNFNLSKIGGSVQEEKWLTHANSLDLLYLYLRWGRATGSCIRRRAAANQLTPPRNQVEPTTPSLSIPINRRTNSPRKRSLMYIFPPTAGRLWAMADPHWHPPGFCSFFFSEPPSPPPSLFKTRTGWWDGVDMWRISKHVFRREVMEQYHPSQKLLAALDRHPQSVYRCSTA